MKTFALNQDSLATQAFNTARNAGYGRIETTDTSIVVYESQAEWDAAHPPAPPAAPPRWVSSADFVRRFTDAEWETINRKIAGNGTAPDAVLACLKDKVMTGDPANPGYVNLDAAELSDGLDYVVLLGIIDADRKAELLE